MLKIDIFCDVIDNFGDAGVCWRLASIFAKEKGIPVNLYINDANTLSKITSGLDPEKLPAIIDGVTVRNWEDAENASPSPVVIETFGCRIPAAFEKRMAESFPKPIWINLEYLSAEDWVEGCHGLPSPHPSLNIEKTFFFPGLTAKTGGIMFERDYFKNETAFLRNRKEFLAGYGLDASIFTLFVFCYPSAPIAQFYKALVLDGRPINILVPESGAADILQREKENNDCPHIKISVAPMVRQSDFDRFLWCADALIVRGEDSFVRAQLAAKPFIWNIYPQTEETHIKKLEAFGERIKPFYDGYYPLWLKTNLAWNKNFDELPSVWTQWRSEQIQMRKPAQKWLEHLKSMGSLADNLLNFITEKLNSSVR